MQCHVNNHVPYVYNDYSVWYKHYYSDWIICHCDVYFWSIIFGFIIAWIFIISHCVMSLYQLTIIIHSHLFSLIPYLGHGVSTNLFILIAIVHTSIPILMLIPINLWCNRQRICFNPVLVTTSFHKSPWLAVVLPCVSGYGRFLAGCAEL